MKPRMDACGCGGMRSGTLILLPNIIFVALFALLGYFMYGGTDGALGVLVLVLALSVFSVIGLIPYIGFLVFSGIAYFWLIPSVARTVNLPDGFIGDWLYWTILVAYVVMTLAYTIWMSIGAKSRKKLLGLG